MATTTDELIYASFPIVKFEEDSDGTLLVYGKATDGSVDSDEQIVDSKWSGKALAEWMDTGGNVRVQHNPKLLPAGVGMKVEVNRDGDGAHWVKSKVVEPTACQLVKHGALRAYSVGIARPVIERDMTGKAPGGVIKGGEIFELSLVDRPANKSCGITLVKSAGKTSGDAEELWEYGDLAAALDLAVKGGSPDADTDLDGGDAGEDEDAVAEDDDTGKAAGSGPADDDDADTEGGQPLDADGDNDGDTVAVKKAYADEQAAWRAREPKPGTGADVTAFLAKRAEWQRWHAEGVAEGLDGDYPTWLAKRDMDPAVGGGVDRDTLKASDFVFGDDRVFPVVTPGDVSDAVTSWGQYKGDHSFADFKAKLTALCKRKGAQFVKELPAEWNVKTAEPDLTKGDKDCPECGHTFHADSKLRNCSECGAPLPNADKAAKPQPVNDAADSAGENGADGDGDGDADGKLAPPFGKKPKGGKKKAKAAAKGMQPAGTAPMGAHREPDGSAVEALEADACIHDGHPDATPDKVPASVKALPYSVKRMHDALCPAYQWETVQVEYPSLKGVQDAVDADWFRAQVVEVAAKGDMAVVQVAAAVAQIAEAFTAGDAQTAAVLADGRAALAKSFADMYPGDHPTPATMTPGRFTRPYLSAGHQPATPGSPPRVPATNHVPEPEQYHRGPVTAGEQAAAPGSHPNVAATYQVGARQATENMMTNLHDHIAGAFPDACPMASTHGAVPADGRAGAKPKPVTVGNSQVKAPGEKSKARKARKKTRKGAPDLDVIIKSAVTEATQATRDLYEPRLAELQRVVDELGAQPDPAQAPLRGVVRTKAATTEAPAPVERVSLVEKAQAEQAAAHREYAAYLGRMAHHTNPNPMEREQAEQALARLLADA